MNRVTWVALLYRYLVVDEHLLFVSNHQLFEQIFGQLGKNWDRFQKVYHFVVASLHIFGQRLLVVVAMECGYKAVVCHRNHRSRSLRAFVVSFKRELAEVLSDAEVRERKQALLVHLVPKIVDQVGPLNNFFVNFVKKFLSRDANRPCCYSLPFNLQSVDFDLFCVELVLELLEPAFQLLVQNLNFAETVQDNVEIVAKVADPDDFFLFGVASNLQFGQNVSHGFRGQVVVSKVRVLVNILRKTLH